MAEKLLKSELREGKAWPFLMTWTGRASALIGLVASLAAAVTWLVNHSREQEDCSARMAQAQVQLQQDDYQGAVRSYGELLKDNPTYTPALDGQLRAAELWVENFRVTGRENQTTAPAAAALLDQLMPVLEAGLARSDGTQAADVQAHIGWAHWLNEKMAEREFGDAAQRNLRAALQLDPTNVYANAMLGNWILQNKGNMSDALHDFAVAETTGSARPLVRQMELGGLDYLDEKGARSAQVKIADAMRRSGETLDSNSKQRILSFCFNPTTTEHSELAESLSAVSPDDAWKTYLWLDDRSGDTDTQPLAREYIQANLLEVSGDREAALAAFRRLDMQLKNSAGTLTDQVQQAIARLSHG